MFSSKILAFLQELIGLIFQPDLFTFAGCAAVTYGIYLLYGKPQACIAVGVMLVIMGLSAGKAAIKK